MNALLSDQRVPAEIALQNVTVSAEILDAREKFEKGDRFRGIE
jgi:hypothetical protein